MNQARKIVVSIALTAALAALVFVPACGPEKKQTDTAAAVAAATPVKTAKVIRGKISEKIFFTGTLEAVKKINITPETGGKIARIYVREGDRVGQGQVLAELDTEAIRLQLRQAEAGLAVATANFNDAQKNKERMDRLLKENAVSEQQHEQVKLAYEAAEAQRDQAAAALNLARHALDVSIMKAPWSGIIASKNAEVGDVINPMMGSFSPVSGVLTLMDFSKIKVVLDVAPRDAAKLRREQEALLRIPALPGREFKGTVVLVNMTADAISKKFRVEVVFDNPELALRPGTFGDLTLEVETHDNALAVPQSAILENAYVFIVREGKAVRKDVALGLQNTTLVEVLTGIEEGDQVIVEGNYGLEDGAPVEVQNEVKS